MNRVNSTRQLSRASDSTSREASAAVKRINLRYIFRAADMMSHAFKHDPLIKYRKYSENHYENRFFNVFLHVYTIMLLLVSSLQTWRSVWTIDQDQGAAVAVMSYAETARKVKITDRILGVILHGYELVYFLTRTSQQRERHKRAQSKIEMALGVARPRLSEMIFLEDIATHPNRQGKGYGGALIDTVTAIAMSQNRPTVLISSNIANTIFYESHGFTSIAETLIGDDDPTWHEKPFMVKVMVKEYNTTIEQN